MFAHTLSLKFTSTISPNVSNRDSLNNDASHRKPNALGRNHFIQLEFNKGGMKEMEHCLTKLKVDGWNFPSTKGRKQVSFVRSQ